MFKYMFALLLVSSVALPVHKFGDRISTPKNAHGPLSTPSPIDRKSPSKRAESPKRINLSQK